LVARTTCCPGGRRPQEVADDFRERGKAVTSFPNSIWERYCRPQDCQRDSVASAAKHSFASNPVPKYLGTRIDAFWWPGQLVVRVAAGHRRSPMIFAKEVKPSPHSQTPFGNAAAVRRTVSATPLPAFSSSPTGFKSLSPGLAQQRLPWVARRRTNPERVEATFNQNRHGNDPTPTGLGRFSEIPRVARSSQPWAECLQPFQGCPNRMEAQ